MSVEYIFILKLLSKISQVPTTNSQEWICQAHLSLSDDTPADTAHGRLQLEEENLLIE